MTDRFDRMVRACAAALLAIALAACSGSTTATPSPISSTAAGSIPPVATTPTTSPAGSPDAQPEVTPQPTSAAAAWPSGVPILDPQYCPPTLPAAAATTADGMQIDGDQAFISHVGSALDLLKRKAPDFYAGVLANMVMIRQVPSFSGMCYDTGSYRVGDETAHPPGYTKAQAVIWLAGTIVHDNCHRSRFVEGLAPSGRDAELACLKIQMQALKQIDTTPGFAAYIKSLIDGVDDPANQYWTNPNRHW